MVSGRSERRSYLSCPHQKPHRQPQKRRTILRTIGKIGISFALAGALALAVHVRGNMARLVPVAHASNSPGDSSDDSCSLGSLAGSLGITTTGCILASRPLRPAGARGPITS